jgi:hypothetical protein
MVPENKQKEDTNKLTSISFKIIPIFHNTLLATPENRICFWRFAYFWGPPTNPQTTTFMGLNSNFILGEFVLLGKLPNSNFTPETFAHFGAHWGFLGFCGSKPNFTLRAFFLFGVSPKVKFYSGPAAHFRGPLWPFVVQVLKIKFCFGAFTHRLCPEL